MTDTQSWMSSSSPLLMKMKNLKNIWMVRIPKRHRNLPCNRRSWSRDRPVGAQKVLNNINVKIQVKIKQKRKYKLQLRSLMYSIKWLICNQKCDPVRHRCNQPPPQSRHHHRSNKIRWISICKWWWCNKCRQILCSNSSSKATRCSKISQASSHN